MPNCPSGFAGVLCELFVPQVNAQTWMSSLQVTLSTKFPFALAQSLDLTPELGSNAVLPASISFLPLADLSPFFAVVKALVTAACFIFFVWWLIDRLTPQAQI